jgi:hypothetical protein
MKTVLVPQFWEKIYALNIEKYFKNILQECYLCCQVNQLLQ